MTSELAVVSDLAESAKIFDKFEKISLLRLITLPSLQHLVLIAGGYSSKRGKVVVGDNGKIFYTLSQILDLSHFHIFQTFTKSVVIFQRRIHILGGYRQNTHGVFID